MMSKLRVALLFLSLSIFWSGSAWSQGNCVAGVVFFGDVRIQNARVRLNAPGREAVTFTNLSGIYELCSEPGRYELVAEWGGKLVKEAVDLQGIQRKDLVLH